MPLLEAHAMPSELRLTENPEGTGAQGSYAAELLRSSVVLCDERRPAESGIESTAVSRRTGRRRVRMPSGYFDSEYSP